MSIIVFNGPTLGAGDQLAELMSAFPEIDLRPPAAQGDVLAATLEQPWAIGLIDGYFEWAPAVWHKEILWALSKGIHVYGSSSMGALRATELDAFGMRGVGAIYEQFADGTFEDDDEVTVVHGSADEGFRPLSDSMVNIRATLAAAVDAGVIHGQEAELLISRTKQLHYPLRSWVSVCGAVSEELGSARGQHFAEWLPIGRVDQKRLDAVEMMQRIIADRNGFGETAFVARFRFQHTDAWEQVCRQVGRTGDPGATGADASDILLDELRLQPALYERVESEARVRVLADWASDRSSMPSEALLRQSTEGFWSLQDTPPGDVDAWTRRHRMHERDLVGLIERDARTRHVRAVAAADSDRAIADVVAWSGLRGELIDRAENKRQTLDDSGLSNPTLEAAGLDEDELWRWFFEDRLGRDVPEDLHAEAATFGFATRALLRRAVLREYCWLANTDPSTRRR